MWTGLARVVHDDHRWAALVPAGLASLPGFAVVATLTVQALTRLLTPSADLRLVDPEPIAASWLMPLAGLLLVAFVAVAVTPRREVIVRTALVVGAGAALTTLLLAPVALAVAVVALAAVGVALGLDGLRADASRAVLQLVGVVALLMLALVAALPSAGLVVLVTALASGLMAALLSAADADECRVLSALALPASVAGLVWSASDLIGIEASGRALPVVAIAGLLALLLPRWEIEVVAAASAGVAALVAVPLADDVATSAAIHLTVAGALVCASALVHPHRRLLGWPGSVLLMLASWVRLADAGVHAVEAYCLPAAAALILLALRRLAREPGVATSEVLLPGLGLATVPSFLQVVATDPTSVRALLLGLACLGLTLGGARVRWSAPLVVGSAVGGLLTLVELAPYAAQTPQWIAIGLAGTALTVVGVTWEHRVNEVRRMAGYLGRLR